MPSHYTTTLLQAGGQAAGATTWETSTKYRKERLTTQAGRTCFGVRASWCSNAVTSKTEVFESGLKTTVLREVI